MAMAESNSFAKLVKQDLNSLGRDAFSSLTELRRNFSKYRTVFPSLFCPCFDIDLLSSIQKTDCIIMKP
nr:hypothetical protein Iba_chr04cCG11500 [Ipomoea batatas]